MPGSEFYLKDDDGRMLREMTERIENLENRILSNNLPPGLLLPHTGPVRSSLYSDTRAEAIGGKYDHWYKLNELEGNALDATGDEAFDGIPTATEESKLPLRGQYGGLVSEASRSAQFSGSGEGRFVTPLLLSSATAFLMEGVFSPSVLPQGGCPFWNGTGANGYGIIIANSTDTGEGSVISFSSTTTLATTGVTAIVGHWYSFVAQLVSGTLFWHLGDFNPVTKTFTITTGNKTSFTATTPTTRATIGAKSGGSYQFKGSIDEVLIYAGSIAETETKESALDRLRTALQASPPYGWLKADGNPVSRAKYDRLFKSIGTIYGAGDGVSTFNLPNMNGAFPYGRNAEALGSVGGAATHVLTTSEMPSHVHAFGYTSSNEAGGFGLALAPSFIDRVLVSSGAGNTAAAGSGSAHNNMPPYVALNYLIKT